MWKKGNIEFLTTDQDDDHRKDLDPDLQTVKIFLLFMHRKEQVKNTIQIRGSKRGDKRSTRHGWLAVEWKKITWLHYQSVYVGRCEKGKEVTVNDR
jgi:hypothetical protein